MPGTEVDKPETGAELAPLSEQEQALINATKGEVDQSRLLLPALKLTQSLTAEVVEGAIEKGRFLNSLTGEDLGTEVEVVISAMFKGRFFSDKDTNRSYAAQGEVAPENWPEEYAGKRFDELPDAEEQFKAAVNAKEHEWGKGPKISTTYNFVGYVVGDTSLPVRISMMRSSTRAAQKLETLIFKERAPWDRSFVLKAKHQVSNDRPYYVIEVSQGDIVDAELKQAAVNLAQSYADAKARGEVELSGDEAEGGAKPKPQEGAGLSVS